MDNMDLVNTIGLIKTKECAAHSIAGRSGLESSQNATSSYKQIKPVDKRLSVKAKCEDCGKEFSKQCVRSSKGKDDKLLTFTKCKEC